MMGDQANDILLSFWLSEEDRKKYSVVVESFQGYFVKWRNVIYEWMKFNWRVQNEGKLLDSFITSLYTLLEMWSYGGLIKEMIRDRIVVGIQDSAIVVRLQAEPDLTLDKAISVARQSEMLKKQQPTVQVQWQQ